MWKEASKPWKLKFAIKIGLGGGKIGLTATIMWLLEGNLQKIFFFIRPSKIRQIPHRYLLCNRSGPDDFDKPHKLINLS